jgi:hypothetical protein
MVTCGEEKGCAAQPNDNKIEHRELRIASLYSCITMTIREERKVPCEKGAGQPINKRKFYQESGGKYSKI